MPAEEPEGQGIISINLRTGQFKCLRRAVESGEYAYVGPRFWYMLIPEVEAAAGAETYRTLKTPKEPIRPKPPAVTYLESRGISRQVAEQYEITVQTEHTNVLVFPFYDENGDMQFVKYRKTDFDKTRDKNKEWCEAGTRPILFGMKQCTDFETLVITEGQIDSLSVTEAGVKNAVSVPTGARGFTWVPHCWEWVKGSERSVFGDFEKGHTCWTSCGSVLSPIHRVEEADYHGWDANELLCSMELPR
ncbi:MAG: toprim domain-containing protein [Eisenbergiella sp.]